MACAQRLVAAYGTAAKGGVPIYELDNEPALWNSTHRDVHPDPLTYATYAKPGIVTAAAIKAIDPTATVIGPSDWAGARTSSRLRTAVAVRMGQIARHTAARPLRRGTSTGSRPRR